MTARKTVFSEHLTPDGARLATSALRSLLSITEELALTGRLPPGIEVEEEIEVAAQTLVPWTRGVLQRSDREAAAALLLRALVDHLRIIDEVTAEEVGDGEGARALSVRTWGGACVVLAGLAALATEESGAGNDLLATFANGQTVERLALGGVGTTSLHARLDEALAALTVSGPEAESLWLQPEAMAATFGSQRLEVDCTVFGFHGVLALEVELHREEGGAGPGVLKLSWDAPFVPGTGWDLSIRHADTGDTLFSDIMEGGSSMVIQLTQDALGFDPVSTPIQVRLRPRDP